MILIYNNIQIYRCKSIYLNYNRGDIMLDIAIIGAGPAGLSAAINGAARNKSIMVFGNKPTSSLIYKAEQVKNYLGMYEVTGKEMIEQFT